jgi:hypothetical protein
MTMALPHMAKNANTMSLKKWPPCTMRTKPMPLPINTPANSHRLRA